MRLKTLSVPKVTLAVWVRALFRKETPLYVKAPISLALIYTIFPIDLLPDLLGPLGFSDDAAILGLLTTISMSLLKHYTTQQSLKL